MPNVIAAPVVISFVLNESYAISRSVRGEQEKKPVQ